MREHLRHQILRLVSQRHQALDHHGVFGRRLGARPHEAGPLRGALHRHHTERGPQRTRLSAQRAQNTSRRQSSECAPERARRREASRLWRSQAAHSIGEQRQYVCGDSILDGARGHQTRRVRLQGGHLVAGDNGVRAGQRRAPVFGSAPDESSFTDTQEPAAAAPGQLFALVQRVHRDVFAEGPGESAHGQGAAPTPVHTQGQANDVFDRADRALPRVEEGPGRAAVRERVEQRRRERRGLPK